MITDTQYGYREVGDKTIIEALPSNIDYRNSETLKEAIIALVEDGKIRLVLNMESVKYMDSSGLGALLYGRKLCANQGGTFSLYGLQQYVQNLVKLTKIDQAMPVYMSEEDALAE